MGNKQSVGRVNSASLTENSGNREPITSSPRLKRKTSNENLAGTPNQSAESVGDVSTPPASSPTKTAIPALTVSTPPTSPKKKALQGPLATEKREEERSPSARMLAKAIPITPPRSDADDNDYANLEHLVSARSPSDTNLTETGKQSVFGGLWNWWFTSQPKEETKASSPLAQLKESGSLENTKEDSAKTCLVLIKEPENGRRTVDKKDPQYQTLYALQDPFEKKNEGAKENRKD